MDMDTALKPREYSHNAEIKWNYKVKLIVADVDETVADVYKEASPEMIKELTLLLEEGLSIFFVTGASLKRVQARIIDKIPQNLRRRIIVGHCSGAELWGFTPEGYLNEKPFYSTYEEVFTPDQKTKWREIVSQLISEFKLSPHEAGPVQEFKEKVGDKPLDIMMEDRGPQITFEMVNSHNLQKEEAERLAKELGIAFSQTEGDSSYDLRVPVMDRAKQLFDEAKLPLNCQLGGIFALDFIVQGVSKTKAVHHVLEDGQILSTLGLSKQELQDPQNIEIWGDKFASPNKLKTGPDLQMSMSFSPDVRSIDFRDEKQEELPPNFNVQLWSGNQRLHNGLLEYLQSRHAK